MQREKRKVESENPHHAIIYYTELKHAIDVITFREDYLPRSKILFYRRVYDLYLDFASYGKNEYFMNIATDPLISTGKRESYRRLNIMETSFKEIQKKRAPIVSISDETRRLFSKSSRIRQNEILQMIIFEARNLSIDKRRCTICRGTNIFNKLDEKKPTKCNNCKKLKRTKKDYERMLPIWKDKDGNEQYNLPPELQGLTVTEKMLIQTQSFLVPCIHIGKGKFGKKLI